MYLKSLIISFGFILAPCTNANLITIDPDDYESGAVMTHPNPHVSITDTAGRDVYSNALPADAAGGCDTLELGHKTFGEWFYNPWSQIEPMPGLQIVFHTEVNYFSILVAELFHDAGPGDEPLFAAVFDKDDNLLAQIDVDYASKVSLGPIAEYAPPGIDWAYWKLEYWGDSIAKVIIGGDSEPTTLDRLQFTTVEVPEPSSSTLLLIGVLLLLSRIKRPYKLSQILASTSGC